MIYKIVLLLSSIHAFLVRDNVSGEFATPHSPLVQV